MNATHLHLLITHLPIYGAILGALVLSIGIITDSRDTRMAAYVVLLISSVGGFIAYLTGEPAEHTLERIAGVSKDLIEDHEDSAGVTLIAIIVMAIISFVGLLFGKKSGRFGKAVSILMLLVSLVTIGMVSWTGYLGGKIRHTEVGNSQGL